MKEFFRALWEFLPHRPRPEDNYIVVPNNVAAYPPHARDADKPRTAIVLPSVGNAFGFAGTLASIAALILYLCDRFFPSTQLLSSQILPYVLLIFPISFLVLTMISSYRALRAHRKHQHHCQAAPFELHKLHQCILQRLGQCDLDALRTNPKLLNEILFDAINQLRQVFRTLAVDGSISLRLLVPTVPKGSASTRPTHLARALWSRPDPGEADTEVEGQSLPEYPIDSCYSGSTFFQRVSILIRNTEAFLPQTYSHFPCPSARSFISAPVIVEAHTEYVLVVASTQPYQLHRYHIDVARAGASALALILRYANIKQTISNLYSAEPEAPRKAN